MEEQLSDQFQEERSPSQHKLQLPDYDGMDEPFQWFYRCNEFFGSRQIKIYKQMHLIVSHL